MRTIALVIAATLAGASPAFADAVTDGVRALQQGWETANYRSPNKAAKVAALERLANQADALVTQNPARAEPLVWDGIITSTAAGAKGGLGALGMAKEAKGMLERAEKINPDVLDGSVYTSLGSLYAQVPGPPIGFGDKDKARAYLQKALRLNPTGIDPNYFYGDFLLRQRDYAGAIKALEKALAAEPRPGREIADKGRRAEAQALLTQARQKLR